MTPGVNHWPGRYPLTAAGTLRDLFAERRVQFISCLGWRVDEDWSIPERVLNDTLLFIPLAGRVVIRCQGRESILAPGRIAICPEGRPHAAVHAPGNRRFDVIALHVAVRTAGGRSCLAGIPQAVWPLADHARWIGEFRRLASWNAEDPELGAAMGAALSRLLLMQLVVDGLPLTVPDLGIHPRIAALIARVEEAPGADWRIADLARQSGFSPVRFRQVFNQTLGQSPKTWLDRMRLDQACSLLRTADRSVADIARACGFASVRQFQVRFKAAFQASPSQWRQRSGL